MVQSTSTDKETLDSTEEPMRIDDEISEINRLSNYTIGCTNAYTADSAFGTKFNRHTPTGDVEDMQTALNNQFDWELQHLSWNSWNRHDPPKQTNKTNMSRGGNATRQKIFQEVNRPRNKRITKRILRRN
ncbi:10327_t:CDS:2, partial [Rhizophagus irregularis]